MALSGGEGEVRWATYPSWGEGRWIARKREATEHPFFFNPQSYMLESYMRKKTYGQLPLQNFEDAFEDAVTRTDRPAGMPPHNVILTEVTKLGLPSTDADAIYDVWLANGFTLKGGRKIRDFRAALRTWHRNEWFPSQREAARSRPIDGKERMRAQMERMKANARNRIR